MNQPVLVHPDIDEGTEGGHVRDGALKHHPNGYVLKARDILREVCGTKFGARVTPGAAQFLKNIAHGVFADTPVHIVGGVERGERVFPVTADKPPGLPECPMFPLCIGDNTPRHRVRFGVHGRGIQRFGTVQNPHESRRLFIGLSP